MLISFIQSCYIFSQFKKKEIDFNIRHSLNIKHMYYGETARFTIKSEVYILHLTFFKIKQQPTILWEFLFRFLLYSSSNVALNPINYGLKD